MNNETYQDLEGYSIEFNRNSIPLGYKDPDKLLKLVPSPIEDDRYFTPSIEDIRVGYECEVYLHPYFGGGGWIKTKIEDHGISLETDLKRLKGGQIRTPYLTKEQIEAEGWKDVSPGKHPGLYYFEKDRWYLYYNSTIKLIYISKIDFSRETTARIGFEDDRNIKCKCEDINTFRYICKLLGI